MDQDCETPGGFPEKPQNGVVGHPSALPGEGATYFPSLAYLFLALFVVVTGATIGAVLARDVLKQEALEGYLQKNASPETNQDPKSGSNSDTKVLQFVAGSISQGLGALAVFPFQALVLAWLACNPSFSAVQSDSKNKNIQSSWRVGFPILIMILASQLAWFVLGVIWTNWLGQKIASHPLNQILQVGGKLGLALVIAQGCFMAPVLEEFLSRGFLLALLGRLRSMVSLGIGFCVSLFLIAVGIGIPDWSRGNGFYWILNGQLIVFLLAFPFFFQIFHGKGGPLPDQVERNAWTGVWVSSQIFCAMHSTVWPAPLALVPLSLGLGWLRATGASITACMVVHAAFNSLSLFLALLWGNVRFGI